MHCLYFIWQSIQCLKTRPPIADAGGFYDSVIPPSNIPADESPCTVDPGCARTGAGPLFDFKRLGLRVAALLISPWVPANAVFQRPAGLAMGVASVIFVGSGHLARHSSNGVFRLLSHH